MPFTVYEFIFCICTGDYKQKAAEGDGYSGKDIFVFHLINW
jgi:hypothetical protein